MKYISTRDNKKTYNFIDTFLNGLAHDGGLYIPKNIPRLSKVTLKRLSKLNYNDLAFEIIKIYTGNTFSKSELKKIIKNSYQEFDCKNVVKFSRLKKFNLVELYHGPTLAFKDIAMQVIGNMYETILSKSKNKVNLVTATSGDTGAAAIDAIKNKKNLRIFVLHPKGRVSVTQRKLMTTINSKNVFNIAVKGSFDDCQTLVKSMFSDHQFRTSINMSGVNSINWARIVVQIVYYFYSHFRLSEKNKKSVFSVPTGNFGDIYAGYVAYKMGLPISKLIIATNENDLLYKFLRTGIYKPSKVKFSISPSMDIQVASNFERLISSYYNNNSRKISELMKQLAIKGFYKISKNILRRIKNIFYSKSVNAKNTKKTIQLVYNYNNKILDPHSSVGLKALEDYYSGNSKKFENLFCLETAHPAKFGETIYKILKKNPTIPSEISKNLKKKEFYKVLPNNLNKIKNYINTNRLH
ncbi:MAG: threonine synthase [Proteobacteria bacterium]|jgi:threonine synthase|nr:threonine synthase [Candidatus Fonsibacter sp. PEL5]NKA16653.1 threonine synthase [Candidatus Fonsibacter sp. PEL55]